MTPSPDPAAAGAADAPGGRARTGRLLVVGVALVESVVAAVAAVASLLSGVQDGSLALAAAVAAVSGGVAYLLGEAARAFARGRRWPTGVFVTAQLLVALVALSLGGRALLTATENPGITVVTLGALLLAGTGLVGVSMLARGRGAAVVDEDPPVF